MEDRRPTSRPTSPPRIRLGTIALAVLALAVLGRPTAAQCGQPGGTLDLGCPAPPNTDLATQPDFDFFAWNTFVALNWPAVEGTEENGFLRGFPDLSKSFVDAAPGDLAVWESYKEKREVFNHPVTQPPWNGQPNYGPLRPANVMLGEPGPVITTRSFHQGSKTTFDTFDETVEVASEALETTLTNGDPNPVLHRPVGPRVWLGPRRDQRPVVYEVKVNYDFYDYVDTHGYYKYTEQQGQEPLASDAAVGDVALPYRTSAAAGPRQQQPSDGHQVVVGYSSAATAERYVVPPAGALPPRIGAIHLKAAWIRLGEGPCRDTYDGTAYHTAEAAYFVSGGLDPQIEQRMGCFGLIGLHIIQRIHTATADGAAAARGPGGTFIFATWEHVDNDQAGFTYSNYYDPDGDPHNDPKPPEGFYPAGTATDPNYPVKRRFPAISNPKDCPDPVGSPETCTNPGTKEVNEIVHAAIRDADPDSVWLNYRLVGTQFTPIGVGSAPPLPPAYPVNVNDPTGIGQQLYLANLVVETNDGLQKFQGLPPQTQPIQRYVGVGVAPNPAVTFDRRTPNVSYTRFPYNMGGCMGCHGVAQSKGYSFSFVLLGGYAGASTDTETNFDVPPPPVGTGPVDAPSPTAELDTVPSHSSARSERRIP